MVCISLALFQEAFCAHGLFCLSSIAYVFKFSFESACFFLFLFFVFLYIALHCSWNNIGHKNAYDYKEQEEGKHQQSEAACLTSQLVNGGAGNQPYSPSLVSLACPRLELTLGEESRLTAFSSLAFWKHHGPLGQCDPALSSSFTPC